MSDLVANIIGSAAAICSITSFAPQGVKIWKERDASSVSLKTYSLTVSCFVLWVVYGVMTQAWPVTISNSFALVMASGVLLMKWRFETATRKSRDRTGPERHGRRGSAAEVIWDIRDIRWAERPSPTVFKLSAVGDLRSPPNS